MLVWGVNFCQCSKLHILPNQSLNLSCPIKTSIAIADGDSRSFEHHALSRTSVTHQSAATSHHYSHQKSLFIICSPLQSCYHVQLPCLAAFHHDLSETYKPLPNPTHPSHRRFHLPSLACRCTRRLSLAERCCVVFSAEGKRLGHVRRLIQLERRETRKVGQREEKRQKRGRNKNAMFDVVIYPLGGDLS